MPSRKFRGENAQKTANMYVFLEGWHVLELQYGYNWVNEASLFPNLDFICITVSNFFPSGDFSPFQKFLIIKGHKFPTEQFSKLMPKSALYAQQYQFSLVGLVTGSQWWISLTYLWLNS